MLLLRQSIVILVLRTVCGAGWVTWTVECWVDRAASSREAAHEALQARRLGDRYGWPSLGIGEKSGAVEVGAGA